MSVFNIDYVNYYTLDSSTVAVVGYDSPPSNWELTIPSTVTYSGSLYSVVRINDQAFRACHNLVNCVLPDTVTSIGGLAFYDCYFLTNITLSNSLTVISSFVFKNAPFAKIIFPASLTEIGQFSFLFTNNLRTVIFEGNIPTIGGGNFYQNPPLPVAYYKSNTYNDSIISSLIPDYFSNAITYTNINDLNSIGIPQNITGTAGISSATISWSAVTSSSITKYQISYYNSSTPLSITDVDVSSYVTEHIITGLTNGETYVFSVKAFVNNNSSNASSTVEVTPYSINAPQNVTVTAGISSATISWSAVNLPVLITKYQISYYNSSTPLSIITVDVSVNITEKIITGLTNGETYVFLVKAFVNNDSSDDSSTVNVTPYSINAPQNVTVTAGISSATISWSAVNLPVSITKYQISYYNSSTPLSITTVDISGNITEKIITGLTNGETYVFLVKTFVNNDSSEASSTVEVTPYSVGIPQNITVTAGISSATISWSAVNLPVSITKYQISYYNSSIPLSITTVDVSGNVTEKIITGLTNGETYVFLIKTFVNNDSSDDSSTVEVTPYSVGIPQNITGTAGINSATINWLAVNLPVSITKYQISYYNSSTPLSITTVDVNGNITENSITGLTNGETYVFSVKAFVNNDSSEASSTVNVTPYSVGIPQNITGTAGISSATINWSAVNLPVSITKYQISYYNSSTPLSITTVDVNGNVTQNIINNLQINNSYIFTVKAFVDSFSSESSNTVTVTLSASNVLNDVLNNIENEPPPPTFFYELITTGFTTQELLDAGVTTIPVTTAEAFQDLLVNFDFPSINITADISIPDGVLQTTNATISVSNLSGDVLKITG